MKSPYFNPEREVGKTANNLPHWNQEETLCFITWRMADSLPRQKLDQWRVVRGRWLQKHPKPWDKELQQEYKDLFHDRVDRWLDAGAGSCALSVARYREVVSEALAYRDEREYQLESYVIMPNHVHMLITLKVDHHLPQIMQGLKRHTARKINTLLGCVGAFWQEDYYDTLIRSPRHLAYVKHYIGKNPVNLAPHQYTLWERPEGAGNGIPDL